MPRDTLGILGLSVHTGWAAGVVLSKDDRILGRFRLDMGKAEHGGHVHAYHVAADAKDPVAAIERVRGFALTGARSAFDAITAEHQVGACAILAANVALPPTLDRILASHPLLHTAEGELFRDVLATVATERGIPVQRIAAKFLVSEAKRILGLGEDGIAAWLEAIHAGLGPPWGRDQKDAALVARLAIG